MKWKISKEATRTIQTVDTGLDTGTGGRIRKLRNELDDEFMMTYGDGLSNVDLDGLLQHHRNLSKIATVTAFRPTPRFGSLEHSEGMVTRFSEKSSQNAGWINGGFLCLHKEVCGYIEDDSLSFESSPMDRMVRAKELAAFQHQGWRQRMDTFRDKRRLELIWQQGNAPWIR